MSDQMNWRIRGNAGREEILFRLTAAMTAGEPLKYEILATGEDWRIDDVVATPAKFEDIVESFQFKLSNLHFDSTLHDQLTLDFDKWLNSYTPFTRTLIQLPGQVCSLYVGPMDGYITRPDHPMCVLACRVRSCDARIMLKIDESCVRLAREELAALLR